MKKFYALALAASVAASASAFNLNLENVQRQARSLDLSKKEAPATPFSASMVKRDIAGTQTHLLSAKKADALTTLEGNWTFTMGDYYFQGSVGPVEIAYTCFIEDGYAIFEDPEGYELPFFAEYDEASGLLYFDKMQIAEATGADGSTIYLWQEPYVYNWEKDDFDPQPIEGLFDAEKAIITFEEDNGISWPVYDQFGNWAKEGFYYGIYDLIGAVPTTEKPDDSADWYNLGDATLIDGWVLPMFGEDQFEWAVDVPLQQSKADPNLFRLVDPYHHYAYSDVNKSNTKGYITFNIADPDHVVFTPTEAGFAFPNADISKFYCNNTLGYLVAEYRYKAEDLVEMLGDEIAYTTFKDDVISLDYIDTVDDKTGAPVREYDANFGIQGATTGGYTWRSQSGESADMTARIYFPEGWSGVKNIAADNAAQGSVEFFNLQGVRVTNPQAGQLVIKRQGGEVSKLIVR